MKKFWFLSLALLAGLTVTSVIPQSASAQKANIRSSEYSVANRYIVILDPKYADAHSLSAIVESEAGYLTYAYGGQVKGVYSAVLQGFVTEMSESEAKAMSRDERVSYIEQDSEVFPTTRTSTTWGLDRLDQRSLPLNNEYFYSVDASNVHAYVIDSGIRTTHAEFGGRATKDFDALTDGQNGNDCMGHGTHVAGTIGSNTWGVAKNVRLHGVGASLCGIRPSFAPNPGNRIRSRESHQPGRCKYKHFGRPGQSLWTTRSRMPLPPA